MEKTKKAIRKPTMLEAQLAVWIMLGLILLGLLTGMDVKVMMVIAAGVCFVMAMRLGWGWSELEKAIGERVGSLSSTILIMWVIGMLIGAMMYSGTLPMIIYYGLEVINPKFFYLSSFFMCVIMSTVTGSSWSSAGTAGVACMAMCDGLGANPAMTAGAVIAGAVFGDKLSPLSETTNLAPACAKTDLYKHIGSQLYTTLPATVICIILYTILGMGFETDMDGLPETAVIMREQLDALFNWNILLLLPVVIILVCALTKKPTVPTLVVASLVAVVEGVIFQGFTLKNAATSMVSGFTSSSIAPADMELNAYVVKLLDRGGMMSMASIVLVCFCGFALTAIMMKAGFLDKAVEPLTRNVTSRWSAMLTAEIAIFFIHAIAGTSYPGAVFVGETWQRMFVQNGMGRPCLSRTLEDVGTCVSCMFPWGTSGSFYFTTLGIAAWGAGGYMPYTVLPFACPLFALLLAILGIGMFKPTPEEKEAILAELDAESSISISQI